MLPVLQLHYLQPFWESLCEPVFHLGPLCCCCDVCRLDLTPSHLLQLVRMTGQLCLACLDYLHQNNWLIYH